MHSSDYSSITLLAIDDEEQQLALIREGLAQEHLSILTSNNPKDGMAVFVQERPSIVLADIMMPGMTGMELLERILEVDPGAEVILMTGHYTPESAVEAIQK